MAWTKSNCEGTFEEIKKAVENGAVLEKNDYWNKTEYALKYTEGGWHRITKRNYDKLTNLNNSITN